MNFSKINFEHYGKLHVLSKYEDLFRRYFQLTKMAIVSHVNFNFESKVYYEFVFFSKVKICENKVLECLILIQLQKIN
jgi:hypothetical protein